MTKKYVLAIIIFCCFAFSTLIMKFNNQIMPVEVKEVFNNKTVGQTSVKEIKRNEQYYKVEIYYPETKYKNLNEYVLSKVNKELEEFLKELNEISKFLDGKKCNLNITFNQYEYKSYISFAFEVVVDLCGAHPNSYYFTVNYDIDNQKVIQLDDIVKNNKHFLNYLSKESYLILKEEESLKKYSDEENIKKGLKPIKSNFENIIFDKDKLVLFINPYQVGPYVAGSFEVRIPYSKIM